MITPLDVNPYAPDPVHASSGVWISGGGADGQVCEIIGWLLGRADLTPDAVRLTPPTLGGREFDFAETIAWAAATCGADLALPATTTQLRAACYRQRTTMPVAAALDTRGALLFGAGLAAVVVGFGRRVITHADGAGVVVVGADTWTWDDAGRIPGARGYL